MVKIFFKILEWVGMAVLLVVFAMLVSPLLPTKQFLSSFAVVSGSMEPAIPVGSLAFVKPMPIEAYQVGDVIVFSDPENPQRTILHRITEIQNDGITEFKTKGDNNQDPDNWIVNASKVKGKMIQSIPQAGYPVLWAQTPRGFAFLIGLPGALLIGLQIKTIMDGIQEEITRRTKLATTQSLAIHEGEL